MDINFTMTQAPLTFAVPRTREPQWSDVHGIAVSAVPASAHGSAYGMTSVALSATATVAKGATTRKNATGDPAFEDPV